MPPVIRKGKIDIPENIQHSDPSLPVNNQKPLGHTRIEVHMQGHRYMTLPEEEGVHQLRRLSSFFVMHGGGTECQRSSEFFQKV